jgi:hypothetical protein
MNVRWTIKVSQEINRNLRTYLAQKGLNEEDLSRFVEEAVAEQLFRLAVVEAQERNVEVPEEELEEVAAEAVRWARKSKPAVKP